MKKTLILLLTVLLMLGGTACGSGLQSNNVTEPPSRNTPVPVESPEPREETETVAGNDADTAEPSPPAEAPDQELRTSAERIKILVAYFSQTGNTKKVAEEIHAQTGGDIFRIETAVPYPDEMAELVKRKNAEIESGNMPELKASAENIESYDVVFIGYPIWAMTAPPPVRSFILNNDLTGKTIVPFCTHDGYGFGGSVDVIKQLLPDGTTVLDGFDIKGSAADGAAKAIEDWLGKISERWNEFNQ